MKSLSVPEHLDKICLAVLSCVYIIFCISQVLTFESVGETDLSVTI